MQQVWSSRHALIFAFVAMAAAALPAPAVLGQSGDALQLTLPPLTEAQADRFTAVGRIRRDGALQSPRGCSGTLIAPDVVLTAGHCVGAVGPNGPALLFLAGWRRGRYVAYRKVVEARAHPGYGLGGRQSASFDVGLLFLETPMTEVAPLPVGESQDMAAGILGYHHMIPHLLTGRLDCPVDRRTAVRMVLACPVIGGNSGGPVVVPDGAGGWKVVAVVSSRMGRTHAIAVPIPDWVRGELARR